MLTFHTLINYGHYKEVVLGEYEGLVYTVSVPKPNSYNVRQGKRVNARAKAVNWVAKAFGKLGMKAATKRHIEPLYPKIKEATDKGKVVLAVIQLIQWKTKSGAGDMVSMVHYAYISAIADSRQQAFNIHKYIQKQPAIKPVVPKDWVYGEQVYLWFENEEKHQEQSKHDHWSLHWESIR